jgi:transmembrane sensor
VIVADPDREREALDWARRVADPEFSDWDEHLVWLEQAAGNAEAFDRACLAMETVTAGLSPAEARPAVPVVPSANDNMVVTSSRPSRSRWFVAAGGVVAAGLASLLWIASPGRPGTMQVIDTAPGAMRTIAMADGTRVTLNGNSRIEIAQGDTRGVTMIKGEAFFDVVHDERRPFTVRAGDLLVRDVGTAFDVAVGGDNTRIAVREGEVALGSDGAVRLTAGQGARVDRSGTIVRSTLADPASADGWRHGRLVYRDAALSDVAADLSRSLGVPVSVDPAIAAQHFTGVIAIDADHDLTVRRLAASADLTIGREGAGWHLAHR